jgi:hypothetical protein
MGYVASIRVAMLGDARIVGTDEMFNPREQRI